MLIQKSNSFTTRNSGKCSSWRPQCDLIQDMQIATTTVVLLATANMSVVVMVVSAIVTPAAAMATKWKTQMPKATPTEMQVV